jgi:surface antigen
MKPLRLLGLTCAIILPMQAAEAQLLFGSRLGEAHYQGDDTKIIMRVGADMLRNAPDGETRTWSNPQTGHHGDITVIRSYRMKNMPCRDARVNSLIGDKSVSYVLPLCQIADGTWKIAAP